MAPGLRAIATVAMLFVLLSRLHVTRLFPSHRQSEVALLAVALVVTLSGIGLSVLRWHRVLAALGLVTKVRTLFRLYLAGLFVGNFLPSTVGGDVVRVTRLAKITRQRPRAFASVVLERLSGWLVLPVITLVSLLINPGLLQLGSASRLAIALSLATLALLAVVVGVAGSSRLGRLLSRREGWARFASAVHLGLARFRHSPGAAAQVLLVSFAYQLVVAFGAFLVALAIGLHVGWTAIVAFMPVVAIVQVLPLTIGGLGLREGAFVVLLRPLGVTVSQAIAFGLLVYALNLTVSLLGAPAYAAGVTAGGAVRTDADP
jgi:glycosyltransferase 2 family protein